MSRGEYAVSVSRAVEDPKAAKKYRHFDVTAYAVNPDSYDPLCTIRMPGPVSVSKRGEGTSLSHAKAGMRTDVVVTAEGFRYVRDLRFETQVPSAHLCRIMLSPVRFDEATCFCLRKGRIATARLRPLAVKEDPDHPEAKPMAAILAAAGGPAYVIDTEDGLRTFWRFKLDATKVGRLYHPSARLMIPSGAASPAFYNTAQKIEAGGSIRFEMTLRFGRLPDHPRPIPPADLITLFDTHVHVTALTDLRDSARMARKHGFRFGLLSILYDERPYGRLFLGDPRMFEVIKRYPDVFIGLGLFQMNPRGFPGFPRKGPDGVAHVEALWRKGCRGIKTLEKWSKANVDDAAFDPAYRRMGDLGMPAVFHTNREGSGCSCTRVANVARKHPKLNVIMAHLYDRQQFDAVLPAFRELSNLYWQHMHLDRIKADGDASALAVLIREGLWRRILFGSDVTNDHTVLMAERERFETRLRQLGLTRPQVEAIMFRTAETLFGRVKRPPADGSQGNPQKHE